MSEVLNELDDDWLIQMMKSTWVMKELLMIQQLMTENLWI